MSIITDQPGLLADPLIARSASGRNDGHRSSLDADAFARQWYHARAEMAPAQSSAPATDADAPQASRIGALTCLLVAAIAVRARRLSSKTALDSEDRLALDRLYALVEQIEPRWFEHELPLGMAEVARKVAAETSPVDLMRRAQGVDVAAPTTDNRPQREDGLCSLVAEIAAAGSTPDSLPLRRTLIVTGNWRVYFNRHGAAPLAWCIAPEEGGWEIAVREVTIHERATTVYRPKTTPDHEDGKPSAWIAAEGKLIVLADGTAEIIEP